MMPQLLDSRELEPDRVAPPAPEGPDIAAAPAQRLVALLDRIEEFATRQFRRLEMMINLLEQSRDEGGVPPGAPAELWMQLWEEERSAERSRIQEEGQLLMCAWKRIEDEERRLLAMRESLATQHAMPLETTRPDRLARPAGSTPPVAPTLKDQRSVEEHDDVEEMALSQFQALRREIQRHSRRGRST